MDARVNWQGKLSFSGVAESGFTVPLDTEKVLLGDEDGFRPMELILIGLVGCTGMDVSSIMRKKQQDVTDFEVHVHAERTSDHPRVFTSAVVEYRVTGRNLDRAAVERSVELSATKYCPVMAMLSKAFPIETRILITEAEPEAE